MRGADAQVCTGANDKYETLALSAWTVDQGGYASAADDAYPTILKNGPVMRGWISLFVLAMRILSKQMAI